MIPPLVPTCPTPNLSGLVNGTTINPVIAHTRNLEVLNTAFSFSISFHHYILSISLLKHTQHPHLRIFAPAVSSAWNNINSLFAQLFPPHSWDSSLTIQMLRTAFSDYPI